MNVDRERDEWQLTLTKFMNARLCTPSYDVAARDNRRISLPNPVPNTQFLIDAIVCSLSDHPQWWNEAWIAISKHITKCGQRLQKITEAKRSASGTSTSRITSQPTLNAALNDPSSSSSSSGAPGSKTTGMPTPPSVLSSTIGYRRALYESHAAVQDVYIVFCLLDAVLKNSYVNAMRDVIEQHLPSFTVSYIPLWSTAIHTIPTLRDAVEEFQLRFLDLIRSWIVLGCLRPDTVRRLEAQIDQTLRVAREATADGKSSARKRSRLEAVLNIVGKATNAGTGSTSLLSAPSVGSAIGTPNGVSANPLNRLGNLTSQSVNVTLARFLDKIFSSTGNNTNSRLRPDDSEFPRKKSLLGPDRVPKDGNIASNGEGQRFTCNHCGAPFSSKGAMEAHNRSHFYYRNFVTGEPFVRLRAPTVEDFIQHENDDEGTGAFVRTVSSMSDAYRGTDHSIVRVRKQKQGGGSGHN